MDLKVYGANAVDFSTKNEQFRVVAPNGEEAKTAKLDNTSIISVKKQGNIEKTANEVQDYLKSLVEDKETLEEVLKFINSDIKSNNTEIEFSYNDNINQMMVQVKDKITGEVIRGLPPEYLVKLMEKFRENGSFEGVFLSRQI
ncbi:MAG: hypothetical protein CSA18_02585 [Deltaproteobacteria bacterium]|nr:MAG: hypothetical protein CSB21_00880 [Deltaproteobacteria bacterium]PIE75013.1 MAG: hypothetical protein CSA18_02585 [Deltaproteobacteria bacterium]